MKHLWETKHPYYAAEGNYFSNDCHTEYRSWQDFFLQEGDSDLDYNLLYRFDWDERDEDDRSTFHGDVNYRNGTLKLFFIGQRKALARSAYVSVCRADEPAVYAWLQIRLNHLMKVWAPLVLTEEEHDV